MSKSTHTPEPWKNNENCIIETKHGVYMILQTFNKFEQDFKSYANASRIVACVNFCEGIDNEYLQDDTLRKALAKATADLIIANEKIEHLTSELKKAKRKHTNTL